MISKRQILFVILIMITIVAKAQFSIDVFYGYNHSNNEYSMPAKYDSDDYEIYYKNELDTVYRPDSTYYTNYVIKDAFHQTSKTTHNFISNNIYGLNLSYRFSKYFRVGLSCENIGFLQNEVCFEISQKEERYDGEDQLFRYNRAEIKVNYNIYSASLNTAFLYPFRKFVFSADLALNAYSSLLYSDFSQHVESLYHELLSPVTYERTESYLLKYQGCNFGFKTGIGVYYILYKNISIFGNVGYTWANLEFQKGEMTEYHYSYTNSLGETYTEDKDSPEEIVPENIPFGKINYNSLNLRIGLRYTFGEKENEKVPEQGNK